MRSANVRLSVLIGMAGLIATLMSACSESAPIFDDVGVSCTQMGCASSLTIDSQNYLEWAGDDYEELEICVGDACITATKEQIDSDTFKGAPGPWNEQLRLDAFVLRYFFHASDAGDPPTVRLRLVAPEGEKAASGDIPFAEHRPNGQQCPPRCISAQAEIRNDVIVTASD